MQMRSGHQDGKGETAWQTCVSMNQKFQVADHDHTKRSIVPTVALVCDIPSSLDGSFYRGKVHVGIKEAILSHLQPFIMPQSSTRFWVSMTPNPYS